jgi:transcription antitermination factor NusG
MTEKALRSFKKHLKGKDPEFSDLTEPIVKSWVDALLPNLTIATITRYIESLSQINKHAIRLGYIADNNVFDDIREYISGLCNEGFDKPSQRLIDAIKQIAGSRLATSPSISLAIDVYLYSFYHAGLDISAAIELQDDSLLCQLPQTDAIKAKYNAPRRKYIFPLNQWQKTTNQNKLSIERNFRSYLQINDINIGDRTNAEFITAAWVATAKSCGISTADICACCPQITGNPKLSGIQPSALSQPQINRIKQQVANAIIDMEPHWYAIRFVGKYETTLSHIQEICGNNYCNLYYPIEEIYKRINKKRVAEPRPTIRNVVFIQTTADSISRIANAKIQPRPFHVIRNKARRNSSFAVIPNHEMRTFSMLVSNGLDILGEDELQSVEILEGSYVEITDGFNKGYRGKVLKIKNRDNSPTTLLQIQASLCPNLSAVLNKLYITVRPEFVKCLQPAPPQA